MGIKLFKKFFCVSLEEPIVRTGRRNEANENRRFRETAKTVGARRDGAESANCFNKAATKRRTVVGSGN